MKLLNPQRSENHAFLFVWHKFMRRPNPPTTAAWLLLVFISSASVHSPTSPAEVRRLVLIGSKGTTARPLVTVPIQTAYSDWLRLSLGQSLRAWWGLRCFDWSDSDHMTTQSPTQVVWREREL